MGLNVTLEQVLQVEDDPGLLEFRCSETGILLWPQVRIVLLRMILSDLLYGTPLVDLQSGRDRRMKAAWLLARSAVYNARAFLAGAGQADVCIMTDAIANRLVKGVWFNRLSDHFVSVCPQRSLVVEDHHGWTWQSPRAAGKIIFHAPLQAYNAIAARCQVRKQHFRQSDALVRLVCRRAADALGWDVGSERQRNLVLMLARKAAGLPGQYRRYHAMLGKIDPKFLMVNAASYGPLSALIAAAREHGIPVAEFQHGAVSSGHDAYNFASALRQSSDYRKTLPDLFLAYGRWWCEQINLPVEKLAIGNPHRDFQLAGVRSLEGPRETILVLGDGFETEKYLALAGRIAAGVAGSRLRVMFRPHPLEQSRAASLHRTACEGVALDNRPDIYQSLAAAHAVVSELSTGLFEAMGLADRVFLWDTPKARLCYPAHPFRTFSGPEDLLARLGEEMSDQEAGPGVEAVWEQGWRDHYRDVLARYGIICE